MAKTKTTPRKLPTLKTKLTCEKCGRKFASVSSLKRHVKTFHGPSAIYFECKHCNATFNRKDNAKKHLKDKHSDQISEDFTTYEASPRELAKPVPKWKPPFEATPISQITKPTFRIVPGPSPYRPIPSTSGRKQEKSINLTILEEDLYLSSSEESIPTSNKTFTTNEYGYIVEDTLPDMNNPEQSMSTETICQDELPMELWDRQLTVKSVYNFFKKYPF